MVVPIEQSPTEERERRPEHPLVTNAEIKARVAAANEQFALVNDSAANDIIVDGGPAGDYFKLRPSSFLRPDQSPDQDTSYQPDSGNIVLHNQDTIFPEDRQRRLFEVTKVQERLEQVVSIAQSRGVHVIFRCQTPGPRVEEEPGPGGSVNIWTREEVELYLGIGEAFTPEALGHLTERTGWMEMEAVRAILDERFRQKFGTLVAISSGERSTLQRRTADGTEEVHRRDPFGTECSINLSYSEHQNIQTAIRELNVVLATLAESGIFPYQLTGELTLSFAGTVEAAEQPKPPIDAGQYQQAVTRLGEAQEQPGEPFSRHFQTDLQRVKFFSYTEAVRRTRFLSKQLGNRDLVCRNELCEVAQTKKGTWVILLPASDYTEPEGDYRNPMLHSRIEETWIDDGDEGEQRIELLEQLHPSQEPIRGYIYQLASGRTFVSLDTRQDGPLPDTAVSQLREVYGVEQLPETYLP